ncbi:hypothetical protein HOY80DRAFT_435469 [Tuber brumale]|nr:hypothetical protein HOY80DRAFT_435469 [Tuber brumale]
METCIMEKSRREQGPRKMEEGWWVEEGLEILFDVYCTSKSTVEIDYRSFFPLATIFPLPLAAAGIAIIINLLFSHFFPMVRRYDTLGTRNPYKLLVHPSRQRVKRDINTISGEEAEPNCNLILDRCPFIKFFPSFTGSLPLPPLLSATSPSKPPYLPPPPLLFPFTLRAYPLSPALARFL